MTRSAGEVSLIQGAIVVMTSNVNMVKNDPQATRTNRPRDLGWGAPMTEDANCLFWRDPRGEGLLIARP